MGVTYRIDVAVNAMAAGDAEEACPILPHGDAVIVELQ
jgi:hypothetical protein